MSTFAPIDATDDAAYHARREWSISQIKLLPSQPELFYGFYVASPPTWLFEETDAMVFGTNVHAAVLEDKPFACPPADVLTSNGQRRGNKWDAYKETHDPLECLSRQEASGIAAIVNAVNLQPKVANLLHGDGETEHAIGGVDEETGMPIRGKLDKIRRTRGGIILADLKVVSIDPTNDRLVAAKLFEMQYHIQAAFYWDLVSLAYEPPVEFVFVMAKSKPPYTVCAWGLNPNAIDLGRRRYRVALNDLKRRLDTGDWHNDRYNCINHTDLPKYAYTDIADDNPLPFAEFSEFAA